MNCVLTVSIVMDVNFHFLFSCYRMEQLLTHTHTLQCGLDVIYGSGSLNPVTENIQNTAFMTAIWLWSDFYAKLNCNNLILTQIKDKWI